MSTLLILMLLRPLFVRVTLKIPLGKSDLKTYKNQKYRKPLHKLLRTEASVQKSTQIMC